MGGRVESEEILVRTFINQARLFCEQRICTRLGPVRQDFRRISQAKIESVAHFETLERSSPLSLRR